LSNISIDPDLVIKLDPSLKAQQVKATSNGDVFIPLIPLFEIFNTQISHGHDNEKVETFVFGIKCTIKHACLLKEFFTQLGNPMEMDTWFGVFLLTGMAQLIGADAYKKLLCDNNEYLEMITTIPVGDFQHETLKIPFSCEQNTNIDTTNLYKTILDQPWCLSVEKMTTPNKILLVMTKGQVTTGREWTDTKLPELYQQHIADKIDVTTLQSLVPGHLDKLHITTAATRYTDKLKQCSSYITPTATTSSQFSHPPKTCHIKPTLLTYATVATRNTSTASSQPSVPAGSQPMPVNSPTPSALPFDYHAELQRITNKIETKLKAKLEAAIANLQSSVDTLEKKFEQKLNQQIESLKTNQADKTTQDTHSWDLEALTKSVGFLINQVSLIADKLNIPTPQLGIGHL